MTPFESAIDPQSDSFNTNCESMQDYLDAFLTVKQTVRDTELKASEKYHKRGKLLPSERLNLLLDPGSDFVELCGLAGYMMDDDQDGSLAGGGLISGIGTVCGRLCIVQVNNYAIKGGTISPAGLKKTLRIQQIARDKNLPLITLAESGGANLNYATEVFIAAGEAFANQARLSAYGIPQITVVHGNATAGGAYQPGLSDVIIAIRGKAKMFLAGPPLLLAATGEVATDEQLGGAEMHATEAGTADFLAEDDADGIRIARNVVQSLPEDNWQAPDAAYDDPLYPAAELCGVVPHDAKTPYDVHEIITRIVDGSECNDFKPEFDHQTVCTFCQIGGVRVGIIGNNGPITANGANKATQFIQLCDQNNIALLFLHNTTGFMVGTEAEKSGIIKHGSKLIQAVANTQMPKISVVVGGSYGAGNYAMCGRGLNPDFILAWPNSRTAVMGGTQAGMVLRIVAEEKQRRMGIDPDQNQLEQIQTIAEDKINQGSTALFGSAHQWDDGLINPADTRWILIKLLQVCERAKQTERRPSSFGVARF
ncbi:Methylmalonyl-CoA carboxyltransferase 12S subunit [BD1-7 clade bacterium]|uniref:Methylmalonyl-CoA carboxyltransferase 12S subunit n=1 Tax=BD1-7 clade bacterium TaxID=2029982 RepID=A0A5S9PSC0_9GAMM|nr:Methylmalonyl-CoA carboxyltransferase 12S subunit [BD1-7 clade bacterium]